MDNEQKGKETGIVIKLHLLILFLFKSKTN